MRFTRSSRRFNPDPKRVITKSFRPTNEDAINGESSRVEAVLERILAIPEAEVSAMLEGILRDFSSRHREFESVLEDHCRAATHDLDGGDAWSRERRLLIGAYFTHEYSVEGAALCNPSIVPAPDQSDLPPGKLRFVMSTRAVGEGHISSIGFRSGVIGPQGGVTFDSTSAYAVTGKRAPNPAYIKDLFARKLAEVGVQNVVSDWVLDHVPDRFTVDQLQAACAASKTLPMPKVMRRETLEMIHWLASSNYDLTFEPDTAISERVMFPDSPIESHGMEDARFVRFVEEDGSVTYYATYTAYDGHDILPQLIETPDFMHFQVRTLNGDYAQNKGMALFPRRVGGKFAMLSRHDGESLYFLTSPNVRFWNKAEDLRIPFHPWEFVQIGNCGSPIETEAGWLVLTHGVGPMRRYAIGAILLDLEDPRRVIGHLAEPLRTPVPDERDGYVPNVVYTCGGLVHGDHLILPYGFSDVGIAVAKIPFDDLLSQMEDGPTGEPAR